MTARLPDPERSRAVLIGVSDYTDPGLPPLPTVWNNLIDLRELLTSPSGTGLPENTHCTPVSNPSDPVTASRALRRAASEASDLLLVYYAGHGLLWSERGELYLAMSGTDRAEIGTTALRCADVREMFRNSAAQNRVLIVDCCFAGRVVGQTMADPADVLRTAFDAEIGGVYVLTATEPNQTAVAPPEERNTAFTGELLAVLRDGLPGESELITLDLVYRTVRQRLVRRGMPMPSCVSEKTAAHLALARNAAVGARQGTVAAALRVALDELAAAEKMAELERVRAVDRIYQPALAPFAAQAEVLRARCAADQLSIAEQAALRQAVADATRRASDAYELAAGQVNRRDELRGRVIAYDALAVRLGVAEEPEVVARKRAARDLLWSKPCDLRAATTATAAYVRCVADREENR